MTFFYDLNKKLADLAKKQDLNESAQPVAERSTGDYSAKKASAGKDIGKPGKMFSKIAKSAGKEYGSKAAGERVAGAVLNKLRAKESVEEMDKSQTPPSRHGDYPLGAKGTIAKPVKAKKVVKDLFKDLQQAFAKEKQVKEQETDESALQAYLGKKKYGETGMKALQKAGREHASKDKMDQIRDRYDKMDESEDLERKKELVRKARRMLPGYHSRYEPEVAYEKVAYKLGIPLHQLQDLLGDDTLDEEIADEGNRFTGNLMKARAAGLKKADLDGDGDMETVREADVVGLGEKKKAKPDFLDLDGDKNEKETMTKAAADKKKSRGAGTAFDPEVAKSMFATKDEHPRYDVKDTGYSKRYTRKVQDEPKDDTEVDTGPKKKGRPKGPEKGPERVTKGSTKYKMVGGQRVKKEKTKEDLDTDGVMMNTPSNMSSEDIESISLINKGEYDREGDMAKDDLQSLAMAAKELHSILGDDENLPEWVQSKITKALDYINSSNQYMQQQKNDAEPVAEKAVSKKQQRFMGMVHSAQKGEKPSSKEVAKVAKTMGKKDAEDFAKTKHKGLPEKVKEADAEAPKEKKSKGGYDFGGSVYENYNKQLTKLLNEGMNITVNMNTGPDGQPSKNITVSADGDDAEALAALLKMAGISGHDNAESCGTCGKAPCGCEALDENSPDWPTNTETSDNALQYSGGLNGPKSTGQTTVPVIASQLRRQASMEESVKIERNLFKLYNNYKNQ